MKKLPNLPIGKSSFESIRKRNDVYVDKTRHIFLTADEGEHYFMSRPRRFGKSLTVSTFRCLFQGRKDLFEGLWIAEHGRWEWKEHPVIVIDFNEIPHQAPDTFEKALSLYLKQTARHYGVSVQTDFIETQFQELILAVEEKFAAPAVILVDEYDKPIIDHLGKGDESIEIARRNRDIMKSFFGVLKGANVAPRLRFVFITGVSKFSRVSIFSELNHLNDITMNRKYADMMGYTQQELESNFADHIGQFARETGETPEKVTEKLRLNYDGYRFSEKDIRVYNPFSVLRSLDEKAFKTYWFETGAPTFLVNILKERDYPVANIENLHLDEQTFSIYDIDRLQPEALLFQTGYITIKDVRDYIYSFQYPNQEVKISFLKFLMFSYIPGDNGDKSRFLRLSGYLQQEDLKSFFETVTAIFASIPHTLESKRDEAYFHTAFFLIVSASGADARSEVLSCRGRIDLVMEFSDKIYIIEFKCGQSVETALNQIRERGYADPYKSRGKKIILMGVNFDAEKRNIAEWKMEPVA